MTVSWSSPDISERIYDVRVTDSMNRVNKKAEVDILDHDGTAKASYPKGTTISLVVDSSTVNSLERFAGWVSGTSQSDGVLTLSLNSFDHFLFEPFTKSFNNETVEYILKWLITEKTPVTWDSAEVSVTNNRTYSREWKGVSVASAIRELAGISDNENFGVNTSNVFYFQSGGTTIAPRDFIDGEWFAHNFDENHKREVNTAIVYYGEGENRSKVTATDSASKSDYGSNMGVSGGVETRLSKYYPKITDKGIAEDKAKALLNENPSLNVGTLESWEGFDVYPNQSTQVEVPEHGINASYVVTEIKYEWKKDTTAIKLAENTEGVLDFLKQAGEEVTRVDHKGAAGRDPSDEETSPSADDNAIDKAPSTPAVLESNALDAGATRNFREYIGHGSIIDVVAMGVGDDSLSTVSGLSAKVIDASDGTELYSTEQKREVGEPLASASGPIDLRFEISNSSGTNLTGVSGRFVYRVYAQFSPLSWQFSVNRQNIGYPQITNNLIADYGVEAKWSKSTTNAVQSSPQVDDNRLYIGTNDSTVQAHLLSDGTQDWSYSAGGNVVSTPAIQGGTLVVGSDDGTVYALDAADGSELWTFAVGSPVKSSPAIADGVVYVGADDNNVYALDAADGSEIWRYSTGNVVRSDPAVKGGEVVFVGSDDGTLYRLDASDGSVLDTFSADGAIQAGVTFTEDYIYFGTVAGTMYCLEPISLADIWTYSTTEAIYGTPAVSNGAVYFGRVENSSAGNNGKLYAIDALGGWEIFTVDRGGPGVESAPAAMLDQTVVGWMDGLVKGYDPDGNELWSHDTGGAGISTSPAIRNGIVYVGAE